VAFSTPWPKEAWISRSRPGRWGEPVEAVDLEGTRSGLRRSIVALVRKGDREYPVSLAELEFVDPDPASAEWLGMYRYWLKLR
jgi:hypothetical protein